MNPILKLVNTHDLLELYSPESIDNFAKAPSWAKESLAVTPYVVVRRQAHTETFIPIGVRGDRRDKRWAGSINQNKIKRVVSPFDLRTKIISEQIRLEVVPALRHLLELEKEWTNLKFKWGPGGSVGFELATGYAAVTTSSDLDIVLFAANFFDRQYAQALFLTVQKISKSIDVLIETPTTAFLLGEYAASNGKSILLRSIDGPLMAANPWQTQKVLA